VKNMIFEPGVVVVEFSFEAQHKGPFAGIPPPAQQFMSRRAGSTVSEVGGSHAIYASKPKAVAEIIREAATRSSKAEARTS
jgi:hypothetical protein